MPKVERDEYALRGIDFPEMAQSYVASRDNIQRILC